MYTQKFICKAALTAFVLIITQASISAQTRPDSMQPAGSGTGIPTSDAKKENLVGGLPADGSSQFAQHPALKGVNVQMEERNDLFMQVDNPISIKVTGAPAQEIVCRLRAAEGANIEKVADDMYQVRVSQPGLVILEVVRKTDTAEVVVGGRAMNAKPLPRPSAHFAGKNSGTISKKELLKEGKTLTAVFTKLPFELSAPVESFLLTVILPEKAGTPTWKVKGADVPEAAKKGLKDAPVGSIVYFDEIMVTMPGESAPKMITGLVLRVTE